MNTITNFNSISFSSPLCHNDPVYKINHPSHCHLTEQVTFTFQFPTIQLETRNVMLHAQRLNFSLRCIKHFRRLHSIHECFRGLQLFEHLLFCFTILLLSFQLYSRIHQIEENIVSYTFQKRLLHSIIECSFCQQCSYYSLYFSFSKRDQYLHIMIYL